MAECLRIGIALDFWFHFVSRVTRIVWTTKPWTCAILTVARNPPWDAVDDPLFRRGILIEGTDSSLPSLRSRAGPPVAQNDMIRSAIEGHLVDLKRKKLSISFALRGPQLPDS